MFNGVAYLAPGHAMLTRQFRLALRLGAAYADDESAIAGDQGRRGW
jgi:hypothetical protein